MSIYTKTGDAGTTGLYGGTRVSKADVQVEAYGSVDELTSHIGLVISLLTDEKDMVLLTNIQRELYHIMSLLAGGTKDNTQLSDVQKKLTERIKLYESLIDEIEKALPPLKHFILPQGGEIASTVHIVRAVCRRAERAVVRLFSEKNNGTVVTSESRSIILQYLNRLSDLLFMMARNYTNDEKNVRM